MLYTFLLPNTAVPIVLRAFGSAPWQSSLLRLLHPDARASAAHMSAWRSACNFSRQLIACSAGRLHGPFLPVSGYGLRMYGRPGLRYAQAFGGRACKR